MTDKKTEALKLALEYLVDNRHYIVANERTEYLEIYDKAIDAVEKALAEQPAQQEEPLTQDMVESCPYHGETLRGAFFDGWIKAEAAHGIKEKNT